MRVIVGQPPWPGHGGTIVIGDLSQLFLQRLGNCRPGRSLNERLTYL